MIPPCTTTRVPNADTLPYRGTSAGGGYSTVEDLARFAHAVLRHQLLPPDSTELLITGKVESWPVVKYAYGFEDGRETLMGTAESATEAVHQRSSSGHQGSAAPLRAEGQCGFGSQGARCSASCRGVPNPDCLDGPLTRREKTILAAVFGPYRA
jgi:CubicO group peptidase (beta-lactamase class C family)